MGCDYYEISYIEVTFNNGNDVNVNYEKNPIYGKHFSYDVDMMGDFEKQEQKWINDVQPKKILYENDKWIITNQDRIIFYLNFISTKLEDVNNKILNKEIKTICTGSYRMERH